MSRVAWGESSSSNRCPNRRLRCVGKGLAIVPMLVISLKVAIVQVAAVTPASASTSTTTSAAKPVAPLGANQGTCSVETKEAPRFWDLSAPSLEGREVDFASFRGQVALVVNTASRCGHTHQYEGLQRMFQKYKSRGFVVLGFPSNDFAGQEPGSNAEIKSFCQLKYGVDFPMFAKAPVKGEAQQEVFRYLTQQTLPSDKFLNSSRDPSSSTSSSEESREVAWNFEKFLVDREGRLVLRARSRVQPEDPRLLAAIEAELQKKILSPSKSQKATSAKTKSSQGEAPCRPE